MDALPAALGQPTAGRSLGVAWSDLRSLRSAPAAVCPSPAEPVPGLQLSSGVVSWWSSLSTPLAAGKSLFWFAAPHASLGSHTVRWRGAAGSRGWATAPFPPTCRGVGEAV